MTAEEFKSLTDGITSRKIGELCGRSLGTVRQYESGRLPIPADVAAKVLELHRQLERIAQGGNVVIGQDLKGVIEGRLYDTTTAQLLYLVDRGLPWEDPGQYQIGLYRTKSGRYFLAEKGGVNSPYAGERVAGIEEGAARAWMEGHAPASAYIAAFGSPEEA